MSLSPAQLENYANSVLNDDAMQEVRDRVQLSLFKKFRVSNPEEREVINAIMDNENLFYDELRKILGAAEITNETESDDSSESHNN